MIFEIHRFDSVTSTNDIAAEYAKEGAKEGTVILADSQTNGRGRMGRRFVSAKSCGIYMSLLLRPSFSAENSLLITTAAAVAVAEAVEKHTGKRAQVKWVNDIYLDEKKVCGILCEGRAAEGEKLEYAVLGIGINLEEPRGGFEKSIENIAGALFCTGDSYDRDAIIRDVLENFAAYYENLLQKPHFDGYKRRNMLFGKEVDIIRGGERTGEGVAGDIAEDFSLRIITKDGEKHLLTGEVSVKVKKPQ